MTTSADTLEVTTPGGLRARATGRDTVLLVLLVVGFLALAWMIHDHTAASSAEVRSILTETRALICILSIPEGDRPRALLSPDGPCTYLLTVYGPPSRRVAPAR